MLEIVNRRKVARKRSQQLESPELDSHSLPVTLHVSFLKVDVAISDLTRVARVGVRTRGRLRRGDGGLNARHDG
jgi:hypothetical protein